MIDLEPLARHERVALSMSGGKDSLAVFYLLRDQVPRMTVYHLDTGDLLPEQVEVVRHIEAMSPNFVRIQTSPAAWMVEHGMPTDLLPYSAHQIGQMAGEGPRLVSRYDCCYANLMLPIWERVVSDGNTLLIRGTKTVDKPRLPAVSGHKESGVELWYPIQEWTDDDVFAYLKEQGAPVSRIYEHVTNSPECARCPAWWGEKRASYLKAHHPALYADYAARLRFIADAIAGPLHNLNSELTGD